MNVRHSAVLLLAGLVACQPVGPAAAPAPAPDVIATPADLLARVVAAHPAAPATASFIQVTTVTLSSGDITQRQRVLVEAPDRMRVDNVPFSSRSGAIYTGDRAITYANGRRAAAVDERNPLLLLGFGVYRQPAGVTQSALSDLGISLSVMREATYEGRPVWIIGAAPGDTTSNQVWFDAARWIPLRLIQSERRGTRTIRSDTRYSGHADPAPTVPRVIDVYRNGTRALHAEVAALQLGVPVPPAAFDTTALQPIQL